MPTPTDHSQTGHSQTTGQPLTTAKYLHLQLTERCNLACPGCYLPERAGRGLDAREIEARVFAPLAQAGVRYATLTGGEPLLHPQWLEVCTAAMRHFADVQLVTNGMLLSVERYEALREAGLRAIKVSLDGPTAAVHDALRGMAGCFNQ
ncbi:MAG: radical SAM protein, partial [Humidesulfovibrio sp.]|nr:radical SAM protein [Humidesulfovibrio sp.]